MSKIATYDPDGMFLAAVDPAVAERAVARREAVRIPGQRAVRIRSHEVVDAAWHPLSPEAARRIHLAKQRR